MTGTIEPVDIITGKIGAGSVRYVKDTDLYPAIEAYQLEKSSKCNIFTSLIMESSTEGSTKKFRITVDDSGTLSALEITE